jgi:HK97 family phage major capsid protein
MATVIGDPTAGWRAENAVVADSNMVLGNVQFLPKSLACLVKVSRELLEDSLNIEEILLNSLALGVAQQLDYAGLYGTGADNQPTGLQKVLVDGNFFTNLATNGAALSAKGYYKPIIDAMSNVAASNGMANAAIMAPRTLYDLAGFTDTTNQPLRVPQLIADNLQLLDSNSVPVTYATGTGTATSEIFVGDFNHLMLGLRQGLRIEVLKENFADHLQVGFLCHLRADWKLATTNSFWLVRGILND